MFSYFLVISSAISYQIVKKRLSDDSAKHILSTLFNNVFTTSLFMHGCIRLVLNQSFLIMYSPLIFVCVGCLPQQLKINRKYITIKQCLGTKLRQFCNYPLNQRFFNDVLIAYFCMVFVCTAYVYVYKK